MFSYIAKLFNSLTRTERIIFRICSVVFIISALTASWVVFISSTTVAPARGGEYTEGIVGQPVAINPLQIGSTATDKDLITILFADLVTLSQNIATSTTGKVWVVTLQKDLVWSDGKAITADDVLFTVHTIQNPDAGSALFTSWQGITAERVSQQEVKFTLRQPYRYFIDSLRSLRIVPAHAFESIPVANIHLSDYNLQPITSGAYDFVNFEKRPDGFITEYHLAASNTYVGTRALIENLNIKFFPTYNDAFIAFNRKSIDGIGGFDPVNLADLKISHRVYELDLPQYFALFFNQSTNPILKEKTVRTALTLATDKMAIIEEVQGGHARLSNGPLPSSMDGYDDEIYAQDYASTTEAIELLTKQRWIIGSDGIRTRGSGKNADKLDFELTVPEIPFLIKTAELIKEQWQEIGVRLTIKSVPSSELQQLIIKPRDYQILLFGNILRGNSDLFAFWGSSQRFDPGLNLTLYNNRVVDKSIETTRTSFDEEVKIKSLEKIQQQIHVDKPAIFLFSPTYLYAAPTSLGGLETSLISSPENRLAKINQWFLKTSRVFK